MTYEKEGKIFEVMNDGLQQIFIIQEDFVEPEIKRISKQTGKDTGWPK